jgi:hypothetical protein
MFLDILWMKPHFSRIQCLAELIVRWWVSHLYSRGENAHLIYKHIRSENMAPYVFFLLSLGDDAHMLVRSEWPQQSPAAQYRQCLSSLWAFRALTLLNR